MSKNIEINTNNGTSYEILYPKTLGSLVDGKVSSSTQSDSANILTTGRTIRTNLASTSTATFDGSSNITPGISGTLGVSNGGTGVTTYENLANILQNYITFPNQIRFGIYKGNGQNSTGDIPYNTGDKIAIIFSLETIYMEGNTSTISMEAPAIGPIIIPLYPTNNYMSSFPLGIQASLKKVNGCGAGVIEVSWQLNNYTANKSFSIYQAICMGLCRTMVSGSNDSAVYFVEYYNNILNVNNVNYLYAIISE